MIDMSRRTCLRGLGIAATSPLMVSFGAAASSSETGLQRIGNAAFREFRDPFFHLSTDLSIPKETMFVSVAEVALLVPELAAQAASAAWYDSVVAGPKARAFKRGINESQELVTKLKDQIRQAIQPISGGLGKAVRGLDSATRLAEKILTGLKEGATRDHLIPDNSTLVVKLGAVKADLQQVRHEANDLPDNLAPLLDQTLNKLQSLTTEYTDFQKTVAAAHQKLMKLGEAAKEIALKVRQGRVAESERKIEEAQADLREVRGTLAEIIRSGGRTNAELDTLDAVFESLHLLSDKWNARRTENPHFLIDVRRLREGLANLGNDVWVTTGQIVKYCGLAVVYAVSAAAGEEAVTNQVARDLNREKDDKDVKRLAEATLASTRQDAGG